MFLEPEGVDFVQDGTRNEEIRAEREKYSNLLRMWFERNNVEFSVIGGDYLTRFETAKGLIEEKLGVNTKF